MSWGGPWDGCGVGGWGLVVQQRWVLITTRDDEEDLGAATSTTGQSADVCREPIVLTGSKDTNMLLGELDPQDFS